MRATLSIAAALVCLVSAGSEVTGALSSAGTGQSSANGNKLVGTWDIVLRFPACTATCSCPGGVPNIPIPALHTYHGDGTMTEVSGGTLFRGNSLGVWEHARDHQFNSTHVFFIFNADGTRRAKEVVRTEIHLDGQDTFEGFAAFDLFAADGSPIPGVTGCPINVSGTRLQ